MVVLLCFFCWVFNPVLLRHRYGAAKEKSRRMIKSDFQNLKTMSFRIDERVNKSHLVQFDKIELGKSLKYI